MSVTSKKATIKKIEPSESLSLKSKELDFFYKILLLCESSKTPKGYKLKDYKIANKELQNFRKEKGIELIYNKTGEKWTEMSRESKYNEIQFKRSDSRNICANLFVHLRHAFAHGYIEKDPTTNILHFQNYDPNAKNECVMDGRMTFENLSELINKMLKTKSNEKENL